MKVERRYVEGQATLVVTLTQHEAYYAWLNTTNDNQVGKDLGKTFYKFYKKGEI